MIWVAEEDLSEKAACEVRPEQLQLLSEEHSRGMSKEDRPEMPMTWLT